MSLKNKIAIIILIVIVMFGCYFLMTRMVIKESKPGQASIPESEGISVVPTMQDKISKDSAWCGTFQLVWNDMLNELVGQDVKFEEPLEMVENLNKQDFNEDSISEEYYYKKFGRKTFALKEEIEKGIQEKFGEKSDVLDDIDWSEDALDQGRDDIKRYLFYTMLKRDFSFEKEFTKLENGKFANQYDNIPYFGIDDSTEDAVREQVQVLYYHSEKDFAILLNTVEGDQVILEKGMNGSTFQEIYDNLMEKSDSYRGNRAFGDKDYLKIPAIAFNIKREYTELENKIFYGAFGNELEIMKAIQTIQMKMDEKGGSVKSEAVMDIVDVMALREPEEEQPRYFYVDDEYVLFLVEDGKEKPYFATSISDITKYQ